MTTSAMTSNDIAEARKFFDFNFPQNSFQTDGFTPNIRSDPAQTTTVLVSASTRIPTTLMRIFRYEYIDLAVNCSSKFDIGNTDVMLVLDTTYSMTGSLDREDGTTTTRIAALREAVKAFYDALGPGNNMTGRIRYGFVPYSSTVNVGYLLPKSSLVGGTSGETWTYDTRRQTYYSDTASTTNTCYRGYGYGKQCRSTASAAQSESDIVNLNNCRNFGNTSVAINGNYPNTVTKITYSPESWNGTSPLPSSGNGTKSCVRKEVTTTHVTNSTGGAGWTSLGWEYGTFSLPVSDFVNGTNVTNPAYTDGRTSTWSGCIEERSTNNTITSASPLVVPDDAYDLQIDTAGTSTNTKWRPHWPGVMFTSSGSTLSGLAIACPAKARKLMSYASRTSVPTEDGTLSSFDSYINGLTPDGYTYHDIGMIWGARLLSSTGLFASDNTTAPNGFTISRHLVFMTDGDMNPNDSIYGAWGYQKLDGRIASTSTNNNTLKTIHNRRLEIICDAAKKQKFTIWVVAFAEADGFSASVQSCADDEQHRIMAPTPEALRTAFTNIAKNIGGLRLSQ